LYFEPHLECYSRTKLKPTKTPEEHLRETDIVRDFTDEAQHRGLRVLPWVTALNDPVIASENPQYAMIDFRGERVPGWLCPSNDDVRAFVAAMATDLLTNYEVDGIFLDRIRFPECGGEGIGFAPALSCFCESCHDSARALGIDLESVNRRVKSIAGRIGEILPLLYTTSTGCLDIAKLIIDNTEIEAWIRFRYSTIAKLVKDVYSSVKSAKSSAELSLDLWPPSYSWLLGQHFRTLAESCDSIKYFAYHKLGGGVNISSVLNECSRISPGLGHDDLLSLFYRMFGFKGPERLQDLEREGLSLDFVETETSKAIHEVQGKVPVYAGIQVWNVKPSEIEGSMMNAARANVQGFIHYCYDWAPLENLQAAKTTAGNLSST